MTHHRLHALALACLLAMPASAFAAGVAPPTGISAGACVEGICEYRLRNGLRVLLFPDASKPTVTVNLTYLVGLPLVLRAIWRERFLGWLLQLLGVRRLFCCSRARRSMRTSPAN